MRWTALSLSLVLFSITAAAPAYEAVPNGQFHTTADGFPFPFGVTQSWDTRDSAGSPSSGSLRHTLFPEADSSAGYGSSTCVAQLIAGSRVRMTAKFMIPSGQPRSPFVGSAFGFRQSGHACNTFSSISYFYLGTISPSGHSLDTWYTFAGTTVVPAGTVNGEIILSMSGGAGTGSAIGLYDAVSVLIDPPARADLDTDGDSDVLWRHGTSGQNVMWFMNGTAIASTGVPPAVADGAWKIVNSADFDADGRADLLWRNDVTGQVVVWLMNGATRLAAASVGTVADLNWAIRGVGDFDGNGKADIVWRHAVTGENVIWIMDGTVRTAAAFLTTIADAAWKIVGVGDFNVDGRDDLLWRHDASGSNAIWHMNGVNPPMGVLLGSVPDANWKVAGVGDTNADSDADIIWRNQATGQVVVWLLDGTTVSAATVTTVGDTNWKIEGVGDFNNDLKVDVLWRHSGTGDTVIWLLNGTSLASAAAVTRVSDTQWNIAAPK